MTPATGSTNYNNNNSPLAADRNVRETNSSKGLRVVDRLTNEVETSFNLLRCNESLSPFVHRSRAGGGSDHSVPMMEQEESSPEMESQGDYLNRVKGNSHSPCTCVVVPLTHTLVSAHRMSRTPVVQTPLSTSKSSVLQTLHQLQQ